MMLASTLLKCETHSGSKRVPGVGEAAHCVSNKARHRFAATFRHCFANCNPRAAVPDLSQELCMWAITLGCCSLPVRPNQLAEQGDESRYVCVHILQVALAVFVLQLNTIYTWISWYILLRVASNFQIFDQIFVDLQVFATVRSVAHSEYSIIYAPLVTFIY